MVLTRIPVLGKGIRDAASVPAGFSIPIYPAQVRVAVNAAALFAVGVGVLVLVGWFFGLPALIRIVPGAVAMVPDTAVGFLLSGMALFLRAGHRGGLRPHASRAAAVAAGLLGLLTLVEYFSGVSLGIDELLFRDPEGLTGAMPGRMAAATALSFAALAAASLLSDRRESPWIADGLAFVPGLLGLVSLAGYVYGVPGFYWVGTYKGMAIHTAVTFIGLTVGTLLASPNGGVSRLILSDTAGGVVARRMLPVVLGVPLLLGWLGLLGQKAGDFSWEFENALIAVASVVTLFGVLMAVAERLRRADEEKGRTRQELRQSEQRYQSLFEDSPVVLWLEDFSEVKVSLEALKASGVADVKAHLLAKPDVLDDLVSKIHVLAVNQAGMRIHGARTKEELLSNLGKLFVEESREALALEMSLIAEGRTVVELENPMRSLDGRRMWVAVKWEAVPGFEGTLARVIVSAVDITERKRLDDEIRTLNMDLEARVAKRTDELEAANRELEAFSYSVSHDLRAPLRAIDGFSRLLLEDHAGQLDGEGKRLLNVVRTSTQQMGRLIDDLLSFSRAGRREIVTSRVDMANLARAAFEDLARNDSGIAFSLGPLPEAQADASLMRQVWANLISNALKFTGPKARRVIEVGAQIEPERVVYRVKDNGVGFDMTYAHKLFGVFQRLHSSREFEGTGVGLALVQRIVNRHGGEVWAEGTIGEGATFSFSLPRKGGSP